MSGIDRRTLLIAGGAGIGLIVAWSLWPREIGSGLPAEKGEAVLGHHLKIAPDGTVTIAIPQAETGQGIWTGLAQIAADELGAAWEQVAVLPAPASPTYANGMLGERITAGATSVRAFEQPLREAGATARDLLVRAAAERWDVDAAECTANAGFIDHEGKRLGFGEVAEAAAALKPARDVPLRPAADRRLIGKPLPRLDGPAKSDGSMRFAGDVRLAGMLFASVRMAPPNGRLTGFDRAAAERTPGLKGLVVNNGWLAALGETWWAAERALGPARPRFTGPANADDEALRIALETAMASGEGNRLFEQGDYEKAVGSARALAASYRIAPAPHRGLEPLCATARFEGGRLEVWAPVQAYDRALAAAAKAGGVGAANVILYAMPVGEPDGRALEADAIPIAVELAKRSGKPVQLTIPATTGQNHDRLRPPLWARMAALPSPESSLTAWSARFVTAPGLGAALARLGGGGIPSQVDLPGAVPPYAIPSMRIDGVSADLPIATGYLRGGSEALTGFANECFVDEMARALGREPFAFRMGMLASNLRLARALTTATAIGGWDGGGPGSRQGLAAASPFGSHIALLAEAGFGPDQRIRVDRLVAAVDCGRIVNAGLVRQQIEGSLIQALELATTSPPSFVAGMPRGRPAALRGAQRLANLPAIEVELIPSTEAPGGVSGLGHVVLAAALANALAAGTGRRLRDLPFDPMAG